VLYTDGLVEYGRDLQRGEELLVRIVGETARSRASDPARRIFEAIFAESAPVDDVALLVAAFARNGEAARPMRDLRSTRATR
jgi:hypothetical protein